ncbi:EAL domain-containing protein [Candidatus Ferrigenium straubiae]|jgi:diguanylate cyclase (GGDEF)-like protein/PAS domain S-box-containing protein|uniref:EAL domain-containing protein n=1 Tax=Candidatus Ferrigenium straubiae TaxID=2919506 RepID=UPI003F4AA4B8
MKNPNLPSRQLHNQQPRTQSKPARNIFAVTGVLIVIIALFNFNLLNNSYTEIKTVRHEIAGLEYSHQIARTIEHLQLHRGLTAGYLGGNAFLRESIVAEEAQIEAQIRAVDALAANTGFTLSPADDGNWALIKTGWHALQERSAALSMKESFDLHSSLIGKAIRLLGDVSDHSGLTTDKDIGINHLGNLTTFAIPNLIEHLGQLRAGVMAVMSREKIADGDKANLNNPKAQINEAMEHVRHDLAAVTAANPEIDSRIGKFSPELALNIDEVFRLADEIALARGARVRADRLFLKFSVPVKNGYTLLNVTNDLVKTSLNSRLERQYKWFYLNLAFSAAGILLLVYLVRWARNSIANGIRRMELDSRKLKVANSKLGRTIGELEKAGEQLQLAAQVFENSRDAITITDSRGVIIAVNEAFTAITGYAAAEILGKNPKILQSGRHDAEYYRVMWAAIRENGYWQGEIWNKRKNGEIYPEWLKITAVKNRSQHTTNYIAVFSDITDDVRAAERIQRLAYYDTLTDLPNRALLSDRLDLAIAHAKRAGFKCAVLFLDMDRFKNINDALGHSIGDQLLQSVAMRLKECVREVDTVARMGGDEFVVILDSMAETDSIMPVAKKILYSLSQPYEVEGHSIRATPSIGISVYPDDGTDHESLIMSADSAMYHAKENGRNDFRFFTPDMKTRVEEKLFIESDLRKGLELDQFVLHYQPQVDIKTGHIVGAEALVRWNHPVAGLISPAKFIPIAEESGLIIPLGEWILNEACRQNLAWQNAGLPPVSIAINLSAVQFRQQNLCRLINDTLNNTGLAPHYLELELTEGLVMSNTESAVATLNCFKEMGVRISIDDFGTGYSSLSYLKHFPIDYLKIDQSFVRDITTNPDDAAITTAIINMAQGLNLRTIAEGVETAEQLTFLRLHSCDVVQGYYFSKPVPAAEFAEILRMSYLSKSVAWRGKLGVLDQALQ